MEGNHSPIILVHGLTGWGPDEFLGYRYWGGFTDIEKTLNSAGFDTRTAVVGPFSSLWDRACELYAYILGGRVDYGAAHAKKFGHERYGKTFPGIYREWGEDRRIHLFGHSMGGSTSRMLSKLLMDGSASEQQYREEHPEEGISALFLGGRDWIKSISAIASPHNGSTIIDQVDMLGYVDSLIFAVASLAGVDLNNELYDFKLDQWGLQRNSGESLRDYAKRIFASDIWKSHDTAFFDTSTSGAFDVNNMVGVYDSIYYFSYIGDTTTKVPVFNTYIPLPTTLPLFYLTCVTMGSYVAALPQGYQAWWPNDGMVSIVSAEYPFGQPNASVTNETESFAPGTWNYFPVMTPWDHFKFVGVGTVLPMDFQAIDTFYLELANRVAKLPGD